MRKKTAIEILSEISGLEKSTIQQSYKWTLQAMELYLEQGIADFISSKQDVIKSVCECANPISGTSIYICGRCGKDTGIRR